MPSNPSVMPSPRSRLRAFLQFLACFAVAFGMVLWLRDPGFTDSQDYVLFLLFFVVSLWITETIPSFSVGLLIIAFLVFALGNPYFNSAPEPIEPYVNTFSGRITWLLLGGFFLAVAMKKTRLDRKLLEFTLRLSGNKPANILLALMITTMIASTLMSNTATTAMVVAAITPLLHALGKSRLSKVLLLGVAVAASTGGMATIIGSPPNAVAAGFLELSGIRIEFIDWMLYGLPMTIGLSAIAYIVLRVVYLGSEKAVSLDFMTEQEPDEHADAKLERTIVVAVIIVTVLLWLTGSWHGIAVGAIAGVPLVVLTLTGVLSGDDVRRMPWDTLLLVAGGLSLGLALQTTGLLDHYGAMIKSMHVSPIVFMLILAYITMLVSNVMSNTAASTVLIPLGMTILPGYELQVALAIGLASSSAMFLPVSTPPNAIVYATGYIEQRDFRIGGLVLGLLGPLFAVMLVTLLTK